jgi:hypothetical protein
MKWTSPAAPASGRVCSVRQKATPVPTSLSLANGDPLLVASTAGALAGPLVGGSDMAFFRGTPDGRDQVSMHGVRPRWTPRARFRWAPTGVIYLVGYTDGSMNEQFAVWRHRCLRVHYPSLASKRYPERFRCFVSAVRVVPTTAVPLSAGPAFDAGAEMPASDAASSGGPGVDAGSSGPRCVPDPCHGSPRGYCDLASGKCLCDNRCRARAPASVATVSCAPAKRTMAAVSIGAPF